MGRKKNHAYAFTEQGVAMLSSVLNSKKAIQVNIQIIRVFTRFREVLLGNKKVLLKLEQIENKLLKHDISHKKHEEDIMFIFETLKALVEQPPPPPRKRIGFKKD